MVALERLLASGLGLLPERLDAGLAGEARQKRPEGLQLPDVRRQLNFTVLEREVRRTVYGKSERDVLTQLSGFVFLAMFREKLLQILDDGGMRVFQGLADLFAQGIVIG